MTDDVRTALDVLGKAAQVLAVGTGESQLHAAAEHIAVALGAESVSLLALLADPEHAYLVADSDAVDLGRVRYPLAQYPHIRRALEAGEVTFTGGGDDPTGSEVSAVFPVIIGRKPAGALLARFAGADAADVAEQVAGLGRLAASLLGIVLRGARALEPIRERTRRITLPDVREERRVRAIERYRDFIDSASDGIVVLDGAGSVLYLNRAAEEVTGYARDGLAGKPLVQIVPEPFRATLERQIGRAIAGEPVDNFDLELVTTSGDQHHGVGRVDRHPVRARHRDLLVPRRHAGARAGARAAPHQRVPEPHPELDGRRHHRRQHARHDPAVQPGRRAHLRLQGRRRHRPHVGAPAVSAGHRRAR